MTEASPIIFRCYNFDVTLGVNHERKTRFSDDDPYEPPGNPDLQFNGGELSVQREVELVTAFLRRRDLLNE